MRNIKNLNLHARSKPQYFHQSHPMCTRLIFQRKLRMSTYLELANRDRLANKRDMTSFAHSLNSRRLVIFLHDCLQRHNSSTSSSRIHTWLSLEPCSKSRYIFDYLPPSFPTAASQQYLSKHRSHGSLPAEPQPTKRFLSTSVSTEPILSATSSSSTKSKTNRRASKEGFRIFRQSQT